MKRDESAEINKVLHLCTLSIPSVVTAIRLGLMYLYRTDRSAKTRPCEWTRSMELLAATSVIFCSPSVPLRFNVQIGSVDALCKWIELLKRSKYYVEGEAELTLLSY